MNSSNFSSDLHRIIYIVKDLFLKFKIFSDACAYFKVFILRVLSICTMVWACGPDKPWTYNKESTQRNGRRYQKKKVIINQNNVDDRDRRKESNSSASSNRVNWRKSKKACLDRHDILRKDAEEDKRTINPS